MRYQLTRLSAPLVFFVVIATGVSCLAQSLNINFGTKTSPTPSFGGEGAPGRWNTIAGVQGTHYSLAGLDGSPSGVTVNNIGGSQLLFDNNQATAGDEAALMDSYLVTFNPNLEVCLFFTGLENGTYFVVTYAWLPLQPGVSSLVSVDETAEPNELVGGPWPGGLLVGRTHAIHTAEVTTGALGLHSGIPAGGSPQVAALNGVQLVKLPDGPIFVRGDSNLDGQIDIGDPILVLGQLFGVGTILCDDAADANDDGVVDIADGVSQLDYLFASGPPPSAPFPACGEDPTPDALSCGSACP